MYNVIVNAPPSALESLLEDAARRDRTTARRLALLKILLQERYLTRDQLIERVEGMLGKGCFGEAAWMDTFFRDMQAVRQSLLAAGHTLTYSRRPEQPGYYLRGQGAVGDELSRILTGSVAEVDPRQIAIFHKHSYAQRFQLGCTASNLARQVVANRLRQQNPSLELSEAHLLAVEKGRSW